VYSGPTRSTCGRQPSCATMRRVYHGRRARNARYRRALVTCSVGATDLRTCVSKAGPWSNRLVAYSAPVALYHPARQRDGRDSGPLMARPSPSPDCAAGSTSIRTPQSAAARRGALARVELEDASRSDGTPVAGAGVALAERGHGAIRSRRPLVHIEQLRWTIRQRGRSLYVTPSCITSRSANPPGGESWSTRSVAIRHRHGVGHPPRQVVRTER
jgi:hypothetical protein